MRDENVVTLGWGASEPAIKAACNLAGHEPKGTRWRRKPIALPTVEDFRAEHHAHRTKTVRRKHAEVIDLDDVRAARQRERDDPDGISTRPTVGSRSGSNRARDVSTKPSTEPMPTQPDNGTSGCDILCHGLSLEIGVSPLSALTAKAR